MLILDWIFTRENKCRIIFVHFKIKFSGISNFEYIDFDHFPFCSILIFLNNRTLPIIDWYVINYILLYFDKFFKSESIIFLSILFLYVEVVLFFTRHLVYFFAMLVTQPNLPITSSDV